LALLLGAVRRPLAGAAGPRLWQGPSLDRACAYGLGGLASFWTLERLVPMIAG
jgi:hypothetical protein